MLFYSMLDSENKSYDWKDSQPCFADFQLTLLHSRNAVFRTFQFNKQF